MNDVVEVAVVTGAGVSVAAGLPTFRSEQGVWSDENFLKMSQANRYGNYLEVLMPKWAKLAKDALATEPTVFHELLAQEGWPVVTQNVDGLHQRAGSQEVFEVHGTLHRWLEMRKPKRVFSSSELPEDFTGWKLRPDMVLFGESLKHGQAALKTLRKADAVAFVGTSGNVFPVAEWPSLCKRAILVDPKPWDSTSMRVFSKHFEMTSDEWAVQGFPLG